MSDRCRILTAHVRALPDDDLNDLLVELPPGRFAALVDVALAWPVHPAGLVFRYEPTTATPAGLRGWVVVACGPRRVLGTVTRHPQPDPTRRRPRVAWRAWTRHGEPVTDGAGWAWPRREDAAAMLAWVTPASGARALAFDAAHDRGGHVEAMADP